MAFSRWKYPWSRTWAYYVFKKHHTQLNQIMWSHHAASRRAATIAHGVGLMNPTKQAFPAAVVDPVRQLTPLSDWLACYVEFDNWSRLSACLSMASYLEHYIHKTVRLAISSDPGVILGKSKAIDGTVFLKGGALPFDIKPYIEGFTKGTWQSRLGNYQRYFGSAPAELVNAVTELDHLRVLRNSVGHRFGRAIDDDDSAPLAGMEEPERLSRKRLVNWLGLVEGVTTAVDAQLRSNHIGAYEVLEAYALVKKDKFTKQWEDRRLSKYFPSSQGLSLGDGYCRDAITFFNRAQ
jgi:hypothetical protein